LFLRLALPLLVACAPSAPPRHAAILVDQSGSLPDGDECGILRALALRSLDLPGVDSRATLLSFATGDVEHTVVELARVAMPLRPSGDRVGLANLEREGALIQVDQGCKALSHPEISPIYASIRDAIAALRGLDCAPEAPCSLLVASDLQETREKGLRARLAGKEGELPAALDTAGIDLYVCGVGTTNDPAGGRLDAGLRGRTEQVWGEILGPDVRFESDCPS
jgi:hypothetical protein